MVIKVIYYNHKDKEREETKMTKEKMMEMVNTLEAMLARSEERQRVLREMIAEANAEVEVLEAKLAAIEE